MLELEPFDFFFACSTWIQINYYAWHSQTNNSTEIAFSSISILQMKIDKSRELIWVAVSMGVERIKKTQLGQVEIFALQYAISWLISMAAQG